MKKNFKRFVLALVCAFGITVTASADNERPITVNELPAAAQAIVKQHFANGKVALAKVDNDLIEKTYDVIFTNGDKLEFDRKGNWTEISCKASVVPAALVPQQIADYVKANYPEAKVIGIERDAREYDVKLSNGIEVTFNKKFRVVDIDL